MNITPQALDFLFENRIKDSKDWYHEHKQMHTDLVIKPFQEFIINMQPYVNEIDPDLVCNPKRISRIYRDTRFSKDKTVFRDSVWCTFMHGREIYEGYPAFYFEFSPSGFNYGCGYYKASTQSMESIRALILKNDKLFTAAQKAYKKQDVFSMYGDFYKKNHFPDAKPSELEWLNRKTIGFSAESNDFELLFSERLYDKIGSDFVKIKPVYDFLMYAESFVTDRKERR